MGLCIKDPLFGFVILGDQKCWDAHYAYKLGKTQIKQTNRTERTDIRNAPESEGPVESVAGTIFGFLGDRAQEGTMLAGGLLGAEAATSLAPTLLIGAVAVGGALVLASAVRR